jgi:hypothetical protein
MVQALRTSPSDLGAELSVLGWMESRHTDETSAFTALFEEHGYLGARTNALDIVTVAVRASIVSSRLSGHCIPTRRQQRLGAVGWW